MKLSAGIVFDNLKADIQIEMFGQRDDALLLERPRFHADDEKVFVNNQLYIAMAERLPQRPTLERDAVILCIGDSLQLSYYRQRCCLLHVKEKADLFHVANLVQAIFDRYDAWNEALYKILSDTASIQKMLEASLCVFGNPLFVIDSDFHIIANAGYADGPVSTLAGGTGVDSLGFPTLAQFLELHEPSMHVKEPMLLNLLDSSTLNTNLFNKERYIGCLTLDYRRRRHWPSDKLLATHLAGLLVLALRKLSAASGNDRGILRQALQDILGGLPVTAEQQRVLEGASVGRQYACVRMKLSSRLEKLPIGYVCNEVENTFPQSIAFEYDAAIVGFLDVARLQSGEEEAFAEVLEKRISTFIHSMDIRVGFSDAFASLFNARLYYQQAVAALAGGTLLHPLRRCFAFQDFALTEMVINAIGELPVEMYYSGGIRRLVERDAKGQVSYIQTLRAYLDHNMSVSKTAAAIYIHRSTLIERIARIERELDMDLNDPDERLRIQILLKAMQIHDQLRGSALSPDP